MSNRLLLGIGLGLVGLAFIGPLVTGAVTGDDEAAGWGPFDVMRPGGHMDEMYESGRMHGMGGLMGWEFGSSLGVTDPIRGARSIDVTLTDFAISPAEIALAKDEPVNLVVTNAGAAPHDFTIPALDVRIVVDPGATVTAGWTPTTEGVFDSVCTVPGHERLGMRGSVSIGKSS